MPEKYMQSAGFAGPALNSVSQNRKREAGPFTPGSLTTQGRVYTGRPQRGISGIRHRRRLDNGKGLRERRGASEVKRPGKGTRTPHRGTHAAERREAPAGEREAGGAEEGSGKRKKV